MRRALGGALVALTLAACSGNVDVHGVPKEIQLDAPFCVPSKAPPPADAGQPDTGPQDSGAE